MHKKTPYRNEPIGCFSSLNFIPRTQVSGSCKQVALLIGRWRQATEVWKIFPLQNTYFVMDVEINFLRIHII